MPTFTAIALDRLIEPGGTNSMTPPRNSPDSKLERRHSISNSRLETGIKAPTAKLERGVSVPPKPPTQERGVNIPPYPNHDRRIGESTITDKRNHWTQITPSLYATPTSTPLPDSPSSFPPSPYIINHKRRGPRLMKSFSEDDVATRERAIDEIKVDASVAKDDSFVPLEIVDSAEDDGKGNDSNGVWNDELGRSDVENGSTGKNGVMKSVAFNLQQCSDTDTFVNPLDSMSVKSYGESEGNGGIERSLSSITPVAEFYDAWEELSSESGPQLPTLDIETELRELRLTLLMEIEKRKLAEETLASMQNEWRRICEQLSLVGLTLSLDPTTLPEGEDPASEACQQVFLARFVSNSIGRGIAKAEVEMEMEEQIKAKNFEIGRLLDRMHYYETVNQEMSQRNQQVVETARRLRQVRKRRQKWIWGSIATVISIGSATVGWYYLRTTKGSNSSTQSYVSEVDCKTEQ